MTNTPTFVSLKSVTVLTGWFPMPTRSYSHLTPTYIASRIAVLANQQINPGSPWLTKHAVDFLGQVLKPSDVGVEYGAGRSTAWFAQRLAHLTTVESDPNWCAQVKAALATANLSDKVEVRLCEDEAFYNAQPATFADATIDFCLIDGGYTSTRDLCALPMLAKLKSGGLMVIDNVNWYLPNDWTRSPTSRRTTDGCYSDVWAGFGKETESWRRYWTSNGVSDTCIWIKP